MLPRKVRAKHSQFTWPGDVNDVRLKTQKLPLNLGPVAPEQRIERQVLLHAHGNPAALQVQRPHLAHAGKRPSRLPARACSHAKKRQSIPLRVRRKLPAGVRNSVYLVERVGKVRDPRYHALSANPSVQPSTPNSQPAAKPCVPTAPSASHSPRSTPAADRSTPAHSTYAHHAQHCAQIRRRMTLRPKLRPAYASCHRHPGGRRARPSAASRPESQGNSESPPVSSSAAGASTALHTAACTKRC